MKLEAKQGKITEGNIKLSLDPESASDGTSHFQRMLEGKYVNEIIDFEHLLSSPDSKIGDLVTDDTKRAKAAAVGRWLDLIFGNATTADKILGA